MIVWINGAFGSGKTTLVAEPHRRLPDALVYDPEQIGFVLRGIVEVPNGDFQHIRCGASRWPRWPRGWSRSTAGRSWPR